MDKQHQSFEEELEKTRGSFGNSETFYDKWASNYDNIVEKRVKSINADIAHILSNNFTDKHIKVLDVPAGTGLTGQAIFDAGFTSLDASDISNEMIKMAAAKNIYKHLFQSCISDKESLDCADSSYDAVISAYGISTGHINLRDAIREFVRILKPGGIMIYTIRLCFTITEIMNVHRDFMEKQQIEFISMELKPYFEYNGDVWKGFFCVMRKK